MLPVHILAILVGLVVVAIAIPFEKDGKLPSWANKFWGNDHDTNYGDGGWQNEHCVGLKRDPKGYVCQYIWLAVRNPAHNWCYVIATLDKERNFKWWGSEDYRICHLTSESKDMWYFTIPNPFKDGVKIEAYLGWKLFNLPSEKPVMYGSRFSLNKTSLHSYMQESWLKHKEEV